MKLNTAPCGSWATAILPTGVSNGGTMILPPSSVTFAAVDDADATAAKVTDLGGTILVPPFDSPVGRIAVAQDPQGAVFSFMKPAPQPG